MFHKKEEKNEGKLCGIYKKQGIDWKYFTAEYF